MPATKLIQLKVHPYLKNDLDEIAHYKGITTASLIKLNLTEFVRNEKKRMFTENGLTEGEELEVLKREDEAVSLYKNGELKPKKGQDILKELDA